MQNVTYLPTLVHYNYTPVICYPKSQVTSRGIWSGDNTFFYTLPGLLITLWSNIVLSRVIRLLIKPLRQPTVVSNLLVGLASFYEMMGGMLLGRAGLGRVFPEVRDFLYPEFGYFVARVVGTFGCIFQTFSIAVKMDMSMLTMGRKAAVIGLLGFVIPAASFLLLHHMVKAYTVGHIAKGPFLAEMAGALSIAPFASIYAFLTDLQLLNTELGHLSLTIGMLNEVFWWIIILFMDTNKAGEIDFGRLAVQLAPYMGLVFVTIFVIRPMLFCVIRRTPRGGKVDQGYIVAILIMVLFMAMVTDWIGMSVLEGTIILGLVVPNGPPLGSTIEEKIETVATEIFMPMFFSGFGQVANPYVVDDWPGFLAAFFLFLVSGLIRLFGTTMCAAYFRLPLPQAFSLGLILNTTGYLDIQEFLAMQGYGLISLQTFIAVVMVSIGMTMLGSPVVAKLSARSGMYMAHARRTVQHCKPFSELRLLACVHEQDNVPCIINILEATNPTEDSPVCIYVMQLVELVGRATPMLISHRFHDPAVATPTFTSFYNYQRRCNPNALDVQPFTSVSPYKTMHDHICSLALQKKVSLIIIPFQKHQVVAGVTNVVDHALQIINPRILAQAPCSVGVIYDRGALRDMQAWEPFASLAFRIGILFFGGPDDREALSYAARMAEHPCATLTVIRFFSVDNIIDDEEMVEEKEKQRDDELMILFRAKSVVSRTIRYQEKVVRDGEETIHAIACIDDVYDLMVVGRRQSCHLRLLQGLSIWSENPELGVVGDLCSSSDFFGGNASVLVMQQQTMAGDGDEGRKAPNRLSQTPAFSKSRE
ncbi:hypothetical protein ACLOJK_031294 [Asimina triloba]